ncbi:hypothetical protein PAXRUDRAFT_22317 [Paxillus rubicundulus Ve08.2h10]|uniref:Uncharacterized protein n=1 Tax=Paxillus rubicundulus Ve08.2h10 TaxID=930991 RepID=A0A0D0D5K7_9AGAM|nr:hypothetical protein PAXRUDRAFT_22317 [Paxillus rubicundulus Ve08.2h10]
MAWVIEALREQVTPPASVGLSPDAETPFGNGKFPSKIRVPRIGGRGSALVPPWPSVASSWCGDGG